MLVLSSFCAYILPFLVFILGPCIYFAINVIRELFKNKEKRDNSIMSMYSIATITLGLLAYMWVDVICIK